LSDETIEIRSRCQDVGFSLTSVSGLPDAASPASAVTLYQRPEVAVLRMREFVLAACAALVVLAPANAQVVRPEMVGKWSGTADIFVNWTKARTLPVEIVLTADDRVTGKIGDAVIANGRFRSNRGWLGRALRIKTDWLIDARLEGPSSRRKESRATN
jgi:hypothetical protein